MIEELLPTCVAAVERFDDMDSDASFPEEFAALGVAVESREREFATTRACARLALGKLGLLPAPILQGANREPLWPQGVVGSMTHCKGYRAAAVALQSNISSVGIDADNHDSLPEGVLKSICLPEEIAWIRSAPPQIHWDRVLFSAKESIYKAWFPLTQRWLGFEDVAVTIKPANCTFRVQPAVAMSREREQILTALRGRFLVRSGLVITAVTLPLPAS
jgi:4'-phosphopantetheinyl transferase EntD